MTKLRDAGLALSLANLLFYSVWSELLPGSYGHYYLLDPPTLNMNLGMMAAVLLCAGFLFLGAQAVRRASRPAWRAAGKLAFLIVFLAVLNGVRSHLLRYGRLEDSRLFSRLDLFLIRPAAVLCVALLLTKWRPRVFQTAAALTLVFLPFAAITFSQAAWDCVKIKAGIPFSDFTRRPPAPLLPVRTEAPRLICFLFDGLDRRQAFVERQKDVELPQLDAFRSQAVDASAAYAPGGSTLESLPSIFIGERVAYARPMRANALFLQFDNTGRTGWWHEQPSLFTKARKELGVNAALVGYYHPYCRVIGDQFARCFWRTGRWDSLGLDDPNKTLAQALFRILAVERTRLLASIPFVWRLGLSESPEASLHPKDNSTIRERIENYNAVLEESKRVVLDPAFRLIFIHWPVPHHPFIYDRVKNDFNRDSETTYEDNLALVDRTLVEMRATLEKAGMWDSAAILITSDHPRISRNHDVEPVPFLLKLPGQTRPVPYGKKWGTESIAPLGLGILSGKLSTPREVTDWLDRNAAEKS